MGKYDKEYSRPNDTLEILLFPVKREDKYFQEDYLLPDKCLNLTKTKRNLHSKTKHLDKPLQEASKPVEFETLSCNKFTINSCYYNTYKVIQSSTSNQENSITQKQFERRTLKRKKSIYNIKTTESIYSCDIKYLKKYENICNKLDHMAELIKMERNARKDKKQKSARLKVNDYVQYCDSKCTCFKNNHEPTDVDGQRSRITIFGQLGLTQDDQYVLNCAANINDKPIQSNAMYVDNHNKWRSFRSETNDTDTKTTQATQVNFNFSKESPIKNLKNKSVQCFCDSSECPNTEQFEARVEHEDIELTQCKSPLVVISVYPRRDSVEIFENSSSVKIIRHQSPSQNKTISNKNETTKFVTKEAIKPKTERTLMSTKSKFPKSRSPSPTSETVKEKRKITDAKTVGVGNSVRNQASLRQKSPDKSVPKLSNTKQNVDNLGNHFKNIRQPGFGSKQQSGIQKTNKEQVKKALVNSFLKNVRKTDSNNLATKKLFAPKDDASKIAIDVKGEKEDYSVLLEQGNFNTGLSIRKRTKDQSQKIGKKNESSRKVLLISDSIDNDDKRHYKNTRCINTRKPFVPKMLATESKLNVKDSIEVCHRRDQRNSSAIDSEQTERNLLSGFNKHYRGDNCSITDPIERDQEIRKLLGVLRDNKYQYREVKKINKPDTVNGDYYKKTTWSKDYLIERNVHNFTLNKNLLNLRRREKIFRTKMQTKCHEFQKNDILLTRASETDKTRPSSTREVAFTNNIKSYNNIIPYDAALKIKNVLPSNFKKEKKIINSNIRKILQVEKCNKPIVLTKKQYEKLKKIIKHTSSKKSNVMIKKNRSNNMNDIHCNVVSIGTITFKRNKNIQQGMRFNRETQTENTPKCFKIQYISKSDNNFVRKEMCGEINKKVFNTKVKPKKGSNIDIRQVLSAMEVRCPNVENTKLVSLSSHRLDDAYEHLKIQNDKKILHTIFKGQRKYVTPNLGTSAFSTNSNSTKDFKYPIKLDHHSGDEKTKKPFLQRLMSCLVMRSSRRPDLKYVAKRRTPNSQNTSLDFYNISTSLSFHQLLQALEISSSIYDSSVSFFSNHSIIPINKTKRGFFNSVRGFLSIRRN